MVATGPNFGPKKPVAPKFNFTTAGKGTIAGRGEYAASLNTGQGNIKPPKTVVDTNKDGKGKTPTPTLAPVVTEAPKPLVDEASQALAFEIPLAIIKSDPELTKLFDECWAAQKAGQEWSKEYFAARLQATNWYKSKSVAQREYYTLENDPAQAAEFARRIGSSKASVQDVAGLIGASLTDAQSEEIARTNMRSGWNASELQNFLSTYISFSGQTDEEKMGSLFGEAGQTEDAIRSWATNNNVRVTEDWILKQVQSVAAGDFDVNKSKDYITNIAKQQYSAWADQLDGNNSINDLAAGIRNLVADEFGESLDNVTIKNKYVDDAMRAVDDQNKPVGIQTTLKTIRKTDDWADVSKNKEKVLQVGQDILSKFGMR
jgi:hypothetical protein